MCPLLVDYQPRVADGELRSLLAAGGAVLIEGARASGKTETAKRLAASEVNLESDAAARAAGLIDPQLILDGEQPRLIDEWQLVPDVWGHVRRAVDASGGRPGGFILAGSAVPPDDSTRHSGAGRILRLRMRPMTVAELGYSSGDISLGAILRGKPVRAGQSTLNVRDLADLVSRGGWPGLQDRNTADVQAALRGYLDDTSETDLRRTDGVQRDSRRVRRVMASLARCTATYASARAIAGDVGQSDDPIKVHTVLDYLAALDRVFVVEDLPAWAPSLRSKSRLRDGDKRHFVDPSLAVAALATGPERLALEVDTLGLLFESMVVRDLRVYAQALDAHVLAYRDNTNLEADAIVETRDGRWGAFEVKIGLAEIDKAAEGLLKLAARVDVERHGNPAVLAVITGWGFGYTRPDGVAVIPIGALAP
jgi:predicted AAA+ superfamily ATPase